MNKRVLAVVLAVAIVLGLIPGLMFAFRGKAEEVEQTSNLKPVTMDVRLNGQDGYTTATVPAGVVKDNAGDITFKGTMPEAALLQKTVLIDHQNNTETEVARVAKFKGNTYYSMNETDSSGTLLLATQDLVLVYAEQYAVNITSTGNGAYTTSANQDGDKLFVWGGEDLTIQCTPSQDYYTGQVEYKAGSADTKRITPKNNYVTIPAKNISGDLAITLPFVYVGTYSVNDVRYMSNSKYYPELKGLDNQGGISQSSETNNQTLDAVRPGETATFYLFSQTNSTNSHHYLLNMLAINGVDVKYPKKVGTTETTPFQNGEIKVKLLNEYKYFSNESNKPRTIYEITVSDVHENIEVAYYFKDKYQKEIIIKGLTGIDQTAYAAEDTNVANVSRYYSFVQDEIFKNVYTAYYTPNGFFTNFNYFPSDNLVLYKVKPGYNPYSVKTEMYYDDVKATGIIRDTEIADTPVNVIKAAGAAYEDAGRYNTSQRYWGYSEDNALWNHTTSNYLKREGIVISRTDLLLTTLNKKGGDWYAIALSQNESKNQQLYLDATPYEYQLVCDLNGGSILAASEGYTQNGTKLESPIFTMENGDVYTALPSVTPTRSGKRFLGWQMVDEKDNNIAGGFYTKNAQFVIGKNTIGNAIGDPKVDQGHVFKFVAVWQDDATADTTDVSVAIYKEVLSREDPNAEYVTEGGKTYQKVSYSEEEQHTNQTTALLNRHEPAPENAYVLNDALSKVETVTVARNGSSIPEANQLYAFYDIHSVALNVKKEVYGRPNTKAFNITVKLTPNDGSGFTLEEAQTLVGNQDVILEGGSLQYTATFENGTEHSFARVPFGWNFEVSEETKPSDYTSVIRNGNKTSADNQPLTGTLTDDTNIVVENSKLNDDKNVETDKWLTKNEDGTYKLTMEAYATGQTVVDEVQDAVPTDYILILDQSGSMAISDMPTGYAGEYKNWSCQQAIGKYYEYEGQYYPVVYKNKPRTEYYELKEIDPGWLGNDKPEIRDLTTMLTQIGGKPVDEKTYYEGNGKLHQNVYYKSPLDGAYYEVRTYSEALLGRYHSTLYYYDSNGNRHNLGTYVHTWSAGVVGINPSVQVPLYTDSEAEKTGRTGLSYRITNTRKPGYDLFFVDSSGVEHRISNSYASSTTTSVYTGTLYTEKAPQPRRDALENAAKSFVDMIDYQAEEYDVDHRLAVVGFSSYNYDADHKQATNYNNTELLTGNTIDTNGQKGENYSANDKNGYWYFPYDGVGYTAVPRDTSGTATNYNGPQYFKYEGYDKTGTERGYPVQADAVAYGSALVNVHDDATGIVNDNITTALKSISAYGGTEPKYGFEMANSILENRAEDDFTTSLGQKAKRNVVVVYFTDGAPGNFSYSNQIKEANETVDAAKALKDKGATVYSIGIFAEGDDQPLTYTSTNDPGDSPADNYLYQSDGYYYYRGNNNSASTYNDTIADYMNSVSSAYPDATEFYSLTNGVENRGARDPAVDRGEVRYYTKVTDTSGLTAAFDYISQHAGPTVKTAALGKDNSILRDIITEDFDLTDGYTVNTFTSNAIFDADNHLSDWTDKVPDTSIVVEPITNNVLNVRNYDYADHYVSADNKEKAQKVIVEINGVKPNKTGGIFASNTGDSGIYKINDDGSDKLIDAFPIPEISRYKYNVVVEPDNESAQFGIDFKMTADDWSEPAQIAKDNDSNAISFEPTNNEATKNWKANNSTTGAKNGDYIIFEEILESENNSGVKHNDIIPDTYSLKTKVFNPDESGDYEYELFIDGNEANFEALTDLPQRDAEILIRSKLVTQQVMIRKLTRTEGSDDDYADWNRAFNIKVKLKDKNGTATTAATYDDVEFNNEGVATIPLKHNQMKLFNIPNNYTLEISEDGAEPYVTSYLLNDEVDEHTEPTLIIDHVKNGNSIIVYNTIQAPVVTGFNDVDSKLNPFFIAAAVVALLGGSGTAYMVKRKKEYE